MHSALARTWHKFQGSCYLAFKRKTFRRHFRWPVKVIQMEHTHPSSPTCKLGRRCSRKDDQVLQPKAWVTAISPCQSCKKKSPARFDWKRPSGLASCFTPWPTRCFWKAQQQSLKKTVHLAHSCFPSKCDSETSCLVNKMTSSKSWHMKWYSCSQSLSPCPRCTSLVVACRDGENVLLY